MVREELIIELLEKENQRFLELSSDVSGCKPKKGYEAKWKESSEIIDILNQMVDEIPMDHIENDKETGLVRQAFIGKIEEQPKLFFECKDIRCAHYYIKIIIKNFGDEQIYKDERLLRLSYETWKDWFFNCRYDKEKEERIKKNLNTYIKAIVIGGEVRKLKWYDL